MLKSSQVNPELITFDTNFIKYKDEPLKIQTEYCEIASNGIFENENSIQKVYIKPNDEFLKSILEYLDKKMMSEIGEKIIKTYYSSIIPPKSVAVKKWIKKLYFPVLKESIGISLLKNTKGKYIFEAFNGKKEKIPDEKLKKYLVKGNKIRMICEIDRIWISPVGFGIKVAPIQLQIKEIKLVEKEIISKLEDVEI